MGGAVGSGAAFYGRIGHNLAVSVYFIGRGVAVGADYVGQFRSVVLGLGLGPIDWYSLCYRFCVWYPCGWFLFGLESVFVVTLRS